MLSSHLPVNSTCCHHELYTNIKTHQQNYQMTKHMKNLIDKIWMKIFLICYIIIIIIIIRSRYQFEYPWPSIATHPNHPWMKVFFFGFFLESHGKQHCGHKGKRINPLNGPSQCLTRSWAYESYGSTARID